MNPDSRLMKINSINFKWGYSDLYWKQVNTKFIVFLKSFTYV